MPHTLNPTATRYAFTLVELLVVIGVVALLLSMLVPSLRAAREQAKIAVCLANLKTTMTATHAYFAESDDRFPFLVGRSGGAVSVCSWSYGGKTSSKYWMINWAATLYFPASTRPMNPYIAGHRVGDEDDVPSLRCPSDTTSYQQVWRRPDIRETGPLPISTYDDVGTSYHVNYIGTWNMTGPGVPLPTGPGIGTYYPMLHRMLVRDAFRHFSWKFVLYYEDPALFGFGKAVEAVGNHGRMSRHSLGFLDGHAAHIDADTTRLCGPDFTIINPRWTQRPGQPIPLFHYMSTRQTCD
jgi:prepilin-type N-terminal cleavage/methylation domain-containing protein